MHRKNQSTEWFLAGEGYISLNGVLTNYLEGIKQLEGELDDLTNEKVGLEERYNALLNDLDIMQDHRKKIEANYQEEIHILNNKIAQLNSYIEELELKYNKQIKEPIFSPVKFFIHLASSLIFVGFKNSIWLKFFFLQTRYL